MIYASDFRKGITFEINGEPHVILDFQHVKPGKGAAFVRTKYRNILTGATREEAFNPNDKFENARIETKTMQYLYNDGELYYFMDQETFEQPAIPGSVIGDYVGFLKPEMECKLTFYNAEPIDIELPTTVDLKVTYAEQAVRGDTATGVTKRVTTETGLEVATPYFVSTNDTIRVDTRTGEYVTRV